MPEPMSPDDPEENIMRYEYNLLNGTLKQAAVGRGNVIVFADPTAAEREELLASLPIEQHTLESMLDPDEISRAEFEPDCNILIWKRAGPEADDHSFPITSVGLILHQDRFYVVEKELLHLPQDTRHSAPTTLTELLLRGMQQSVTEFMQRLREIRATAKEIQNRLTRTLDNRELLRMFDLSESLVYAVDAMDANGTVLRRLAAAAKGLGFSEREIDLLDEVMIDNAQASRQGHIYINVFAGLMDARGNIVNNNMNVLLKNLTIVNVVFLPLGVIAGMGGMSEFSRYLDDHHWHFLPGYLTFTVCLATLGLLIWWVIRWWITRLMESEKLNGH